MILAELAKYLQEHNQDIVKNRTTISLLSAWVLSILDKKPTNNVEKVIHAEITLAKNKSGDFLLVAKSKSGQKLTKTLYNFALSYEQHILRKWLEDKKATDFTEKKEF